MLHVDQHLQIRLLHRDGLSIRQIAKRLGHSRDTVKKAIVQPTPLPYTRTAPASCPKLGAFIGRIDQILLEDVSAPRKQRHTAARIFQRLREEDAYAGGYDQVRRYVSGRRKRERETHLLLDHPPGGRVECDFGHIHVDFPDGRRLVPVLLAVWSYSHYPFAIALPDETTGSILHGMVCAMEFFGCVPAELWWDNPKTVATSILRGRDRQLNLHYAGLASHYRFAPMFCMPARGQEKGDVERTVFALERRFATPVPAVSDLDGLNRHLLGCCLKERERTVSGRDRTIGEMFEEERRHALELPARPFDACLQHIRQADKYQTVRFEEARYSVPRQVAFEPVTVKAYPERIVLVHKGQVVARHRRSRAPGEQVLDPAHFLAALERKPAYLDHTKLFKELKLPPAFAELRRRFETEHGQRTGTRHYIRVLQLLGRHSAEQVARAIDACLHRHDLRAEFIEQKLDSIERKPAATSRGEALSSPIHPMPRAGPDGSPTATPSATLSLFEVNAITIPTVTVPPPDLRRFDQLLIHRSQSQGEEDVREEPAGDAIEAQPQDAAPADDAGGVCPALA
jgi:transposase